MKTIDADNFFGPRLKNQWVLFLSGSLFLHLFVVLLWNFLSPLPRFFDSSRNGPLQSIELVELPEQWKTVGKKEGKKGAVTPRQMAFKSIAPTIIPPQKLIPPELSNNTKWSDLSVTSGNQTATKGLSKIQTGLISAPVKSLKEMAATDLSKLGQLARGDLGQIGKSGLSIQFEIPEGVDIDELNQSEMLLYAFRQRIEELYLSSLFRAYQDYVLKNPHILAKLQAVAGDSVLTGKISYDSDGEKIRLAFPSVSSSQDLNGFFEEVLRGVEKIPNPPGILFKKNESFSLAYSLFIKN